MPYKEYKRHLGDFGVHRNLYLGATGSYINFQVSRDGTTGVGADGFGFRLQNGVVQFRHVTGEWQDVGSGAGDVGATGVGSIGSTGPQGNTGIAGIGINGAQGVTGISIAGYTGVQGDQGPQGSTGLVGLGLPGVQGETGTQGIGIQGVTGDPGGPRGFTGLRGVTGPSGSGGKYVETISAWISDGDGSYQADITHSLGSLDVMVQTYDPNNGLGLEVENIERLGADSIRLFVSDDSVTVRVIITT